MKKLWAKWILHLRGYCTKHGVKKEFGSVGSVCYRYCPTCERVKEAKEQQMISDLIEAAGLVMTVINEIVFGLARIRHQPDTRAHQVEINSER